MLKYGDYNIHARRYNIHARRKQFMFDVCMKYECIIVCVLLMFWCDRLRFFDKASIVTNPNELNEDGNAKYKWRLCSVQQVKNLKCVTAILPVWVTGIACFILTDQQNIYGILQAMQMDKTFGPHNFQVPAGWMNLVSMITLAIWISLYECVIIPIVKQITGRKKRLTLKHRIEIGIAFFLG